LVFNINGGATGGFKISGVNTAGNAVTASAVFLFSTEDGTILGWNPGVNPVGFDPAKAGKYAIIAVNNASHGAVYKGLAIATDSTGRTLLYAPNFSAGTVDVFDNTLSTPTNLPADAFADPKLNKGYAPFNVVPIGGMLFVT